MIADGPKQLMWMSRVSILEFCRSYTTELGRKRTELRPDQARAIPPVATRPRLRAKPPTTRPILTRRLLLQAIMVSLANQTMNHQKTISQDHQDQVSRMDQDYLQLIIKGMKQLSSMQRMLTCIISLDLSHPKWVEGVEEAKCPETNLVTVADKVGRKPVVVTSPVVSISVGPAVRLNNSITVKFAKFPVQVLRLTKTIWMVKSTRKRRQPSVLASLWFPPRGLELPCTVNFAM